nr:DHA2 family efflux MFS transporter permease subunit [Kineosporia mesophila]
MRLILIAVSVALMAVIASVSGLNVAQNELSVAFGASQSGVLWIINIYTLALASLLLPLGAIGDRWGRRTMLLAGLVVFGIASAAGAVAPSAELMLAARLMAGVGAAMVMPVTLAIITSTFPEEQRGRAIGVWTGVGGSGGVVGLFLSAFLVDAADWRWLFVLPVVLAAVSMVMTLKVIPNSVEQSEHGFDVVGALSSVVAVAGLIFALQEGPERGWSDVTTLVGSAVGVLSAALFVVWQLRRRDAALLDVRLFRERGLSAGSITLVTAFGVQAGIMVALLPFLQAVLGWSALVSSLGMLPMAVMLVVAAGLAPGLGVRIGTRGALTIGIAVMTTGLVLLALRVSADGGYLAVLPGLLALGFGSGLVMTPSTEAITGALPPEKQGVASALNDVTREFGTALGVALLGALLSSGYRKAMAGQALNLPPDIAQTAGDGIANALAVANGAGASTQELVLAAQQSFVEGWQQAMWVGAAITGVLLLAVAILGPRASADPDHEPVPSSLPG